MTDKLPTALVSVDDVRAVQPVLAEHLRDASPQLVPFTAFPAAPPERAVAYGAPPPVMVVSTFGSGELSTVVDRPAAGIPHRITEGDEIGLSRPLLHPYPRTDRYHPWPEPLYDQAGQLTVTGDPASTVQVAAHAFLAAANADAVRTFADLAPSRLGKSYRREADELTRYSDASAALIPDLAAEWWPAMRAELLAAPRRLPPPPPPDTRNPSWH